MHTDNEDIAVRMAAVHIVCNVRVGRAKAWCGANLVLVFRRTVLSCVSGVPRRTWVMSPRRRWKLAFVSGFWELRPRPPPGLCPWIPLGDFRAPDPLFCPP